MDIRPMIIGLGPNVTLIPAGTPDSAELAERQRRQTDQQERGGVNVEGRAERVDPDALQRRVEALQAAENSRLKKQREEQDLPRDRQQALESYRTTQAASNGRRSDGELVGIDLFV